MNNLTHLLFFYGELGKQYRSFPTNIHDKLYKDLPIPHAMECGEPAKMWEKSEKFNAKKDNQNFDSSFQFGCIYRRT